MNTRSDGREGSDVVTATDVHGEAARIAAMGNGDRRSGKPERATATLGRGQSVVVVGRTLTIDSFIKTLQEVLAKARRAKAYGLHLDSFLKMLREMGQR